MQSVGKIRRRSNQ